MEHFLEFLSFNFIYLIAFCVNIVLYLYGKISGKVSIAFTILILIVFVYLLFTSNPGCVWMPCKVSGIDIPDKEEEEENKEKNKEGKKEENKEKNEKKSIRKMNPSEVLGYFELGSQLPVIEYKGEVSMFWHKVQMTIRRRGRYIMIHELKCDGKFCPGNDPIDYYDLRGKWAYLSRKTDQGYLCTGPLVDTAKEKFTSSGRKVLSDIYAAFKEDGSVVASSGVRICGGFVPLFTWGNFCTSYITLRIPGKRTN